MRLHDPIPSLEGASRWIGGGPVRAADLRGRPVLIHLWSAACDACREQLPTLHHWAHEYGPRGLQIVGVHARSLPEQSDEDAIAVAEEMGLDHPIALDARRAPIAQRLGVEYVPSYFVFDARGQLRHRQSGYRADEGTDAALRRVIEEAEALSPHSEH
jgi:thiol-disulfide isomerase/thioredoxin